MTNMQEMLGSMGEGEEGIATNVDIVFVIDATRSMRTTIDMVKESALSFQDKLYDFMDEAKRSINNLRIKVVSVIFIMTETTLMMSLSSLNFRKRRKNSVIL